MNASIKRAAEIIGVPEEILVGLADQMLNVTLSDAQGPVVDLELHSDDSGAWVTAHLNPERYGPSGQY